MPWAELFSLVMPHYAKGETGRKSAGADMMLRVNFLQQWFALSGPAVADALYKSPVLRRFAGIGLGGALAPGETTIHNFRHLLEAHDQGGQRCRCSHAAGSIARWRKEDLERCGTSGASGGDSQSRARRRRA